MDTDQRDTSESNANIIDRPINCATARHLMDRPHWQSGAEGKHLMDHLLTCSECAQEVQIEEAFREIIVPAKLPQPSAAFEMNLISMLKIQPRAKCLPQIEQTLLGNWGWIGGIATAAIFGAFNIRTIITAVSSLLQLANAQIASVSAGKFTTAVHSFGGATPSMPGFNESLALNLIIGALIVAGGLFTIGWSVKR